MQKVGSGIIAVVLWAVPGGVWGEPAPFGLEFQVNTYTSGHQDAPAICHDAAGNFVVAWQSLGQDGDGDGVFAQRFASTGLPAGSEFQVNTYTTSTQRSPAVCCDAQGNFVVTWGSSHQDGENEGIFAQRFASTGLPVGSEFQVNTYTTESQSFPAICCDPQGDFVVTWDSEQDGDRDGIFAQQFASTGVPMGSEFQVNTYTTEFQGFPAACCDAQGDFVVSWVSYGQDGESHGVFGQRFASTGLPAGSEFQVNTYTTSSQNGPAICCDAQGDFVVAWGSVQDGDGYGVFSQRFAKTGLPVGSEFQVNTYTTSVQLSPAVCCDPPGNFVVAWEFYFGERGVSGQRFASTGDPVGGEFLASTYTAAAQGGPALSCGVPGDFVVAWESVGQDGDGEGVFGRRFGDLQRTSPAPVLSNWGLIAVSAILLLVGCLALRRLGLGRWAWLRPRPRA